MESSTTTEGAYRLAHTASIEGRLENVLERQKQLLALHRVLKRKGDAIAEALEKDQNIPPEQTLVEVDVALALIKKLYDRLDFPASLDTEKKLKAGDSVSKRLFAVGLVLVVASRYSPIGSLVAPLAAAIAAGCSVLVLPTSTAPSLHFLLRDILTDALDKEAIVIVANDDGKALQEVAQLHFAAASLPDNELSLSLRGALRRANSNIRLLEASDGLPFIVVDRSSTDLKAVAEHISKPLLSITPLNRPRAPRLCLVDEFVIDELARYLEQSTATLHKIRPEHRNTRSQLGRALREQFPSLAQKLKREDIGSIPPVIVLDGKEDSITGDKLQHVVRLLTLHGGELLLAPTKSLDHVIDLVNNLNKTSPSQAIYLFGESKEAFYLSTFIDCQHAFVNHIPPRSLALIAPYSTEDSYVLPYQVEDFSNGRAIIQKRLTSPPQEIFHRHRALNSVLSAKKVYQPQGGMFSFFIQGVLVGVSVVLVSLAGVVYTGHTILRKH